MRGILESAQQSNAMPPKGELDAVSQKKAKAAVPAWFDQDFVSLFTQLPTSFRRKHEIFYGMPSDHKFMNLEVAFQQLCRVHEEANAKRFTHGTIQFLEAGIVLQIIMNKYVTQNKLDGKLQHPFRAYNKLNRTRSVSALVGSHEKGTPAPNLLS